MAPTLRGAARRHLVFLSRPDRSHLYPTLGLAEELGARGNHVTFATGDPYVEETAGPGVTVVRVGRTERSLAFNRRVAASPPDAVVCDPRTYGAGADLAVKWGVPLVVAHTNLSDDPRWPGEQAFGENYVFVDPTGRGTVHDEWAPMGRRPVLMVSLGAVEDASMGLLVHAFGDTEYQVVMASPGDSPSRFAVLEHASVCLIDGSLDAVSAAMRQGVPMVLAPRTADQRENAARVEAAGLGVVLRLLDTSPTALRRAIERVAADEAMRAAAREARAAVQVAGSPAYAADSVESLLTVRLPQAA
jgi:UDP:flavonoid glycosyltransferase YjiC (YdhE family)